MPAALCYAAVFSLTAAPGTDGESTRGWLAIVGLGDWNTLLRASAHIGVFGTLAVLLRGAAGRGLSARRSGAVRATWIAAILALVLAMTDELHQGTVPGRHARWIDVGYDGLGILMGLAALGWAWRRWVIAEIT